MDIFYYKMVTKPLWFKEIMKMESVISSCNHLSISIPLITHKASWIIYFSFSKGSCNDDDFKIFSLLGKIVYVGHFSSFLVFYLKLILFKFKNLPDSFIDNEKFLSS